MAAKRVGRAITQVSMSGSLTSMVYIAVPLVFGTVSTLGSLLAPMRRHASGAFGLNGPDSSICCASANELAKAGRMAGRIFDDALLDGDGGGIDVPGLGSRCD